MSPHPNASISTPITINLDALAVVFKWLRFSEAMILSQTCATFSSVADDVDSLWKEGRRFFKFPALDPPHDQSDRAVIKLAIHGGPCDACGKQCVGPPWSFALCRRACSASCVKVVIEEFVEVVDSAPENLAIGRSLPFHPCAGGRMYDKVRWAEAVADHARSAVLSRDLAPRPVVPRFHTVEKWKVSYKEDKAATLRRNLRRLGVFAKHNRVSLKTLLGDPTLAYFLRHWGEHLLDFSAEWPEIQEKVIAESGLILNPMPFPVDRLPSLRRKLPPRAPAESVPVSRPRVIFIPFIAHRPLQPEAAESETQERPTKRLRGLATPVFSPPSVTLRRRRTAANMAITTHPSTGANATAGASSSGTTTTSSSPGHVYAAPTVDFAAIGSFSTVPRLPGFPRVLF